MNTKLTLLLLTAIPLFGCEKDQKEITLNSNVSILAGCNYYSLERNHNVPTNRSCIQYTYDQSTNKLVLKHCNAGFNCCPGLISCETQLIGNSIKIIEKEEVGGCQCLCIYDLEITINNVESKEYRIEIIEPYTDNLEELSATINLNTNPAGEFCVNRDQYPWGF